MASSISHQIMGNGDYGCFQKCYGVAGAASSSSSSFVSLGRRSYDDAQQEMKSTEDLLASELSKLSVQERSKAMDDLHCVGQDLTETPELIANSLKEMDLALEERNAPIYNIALAQNKAYVEDRNLKLRFLRANNHDAKMSANKMVGFLSRKDTYFGRDKLARDITLDDLNEEDRGLLSSGMYHIQDGLDRNGRIVLYVLNHALVNYKIESLIRLNYFIFFNMLSPLESVQKKGIVLCYYDMSTPDKPCGLPSLDASLKFVDFATKVPVRRSAIHVCLKAIPGSLASNNIIIGGILQRARQYAKARARVHYGSDIELQYKLRGHGFPPETIPVDIGGNIRKDIQNVWFQTYVANEWHRIFALASHMPLVEEEKKKSLLPPVVVGGGKDNGLCNDIATPTNNPAAVPSPHCKSPITTTTTVESLLLLEPTPKDVLLGRGRGIHKHPGNARFREFLKRYQEQFDNTPKYTRNKTYAELTNILMDDGVRFLQKTESGDGWVESSFFAAETKVKQFFRSQRKSAIKKSGMMNL